METPRVPSLLLIIAGLTRSPCLWRLVLGWAGGSPEEAQRRPIGELPTGAGPSRMDLDPAFRPFPLWVSYSTFTLEHRRPGSLEKDTM